MFVSQQIATESDADCYAVRVTFSNGVPSSRQLAITDSPIDDEDETACSEIEGAQCIDGVVSGQTMTFSQCGIYTDSPKFVSLFVDGMTVDQMEFVLTNGMVLQSPGPSLSLLPDECTTMLLDAMTLYTQRGLMVQSHMVYADQCTMAISVCDMFPDRDSIPASCSVFDWIDEDKEWESSNEQCIPDQSMQLITMCNVGEGAGAGECTPSINYIPCTEYRSEPVPRMESEAPTQIASVMAVVCCGLSVLFLMALIGLFFKGIVALCRRTGQLCRRREGLVREEADRGERKTMKHEV